MALPDAMAMRGKAPANTGRANDEGRETDDLLEFPADSGNLTGPFV